MTLRRPRNKELLLFQSTQLSLHRSQIRRAANRAEAQVSIKAVRRHGINHLMALSTTNPLGLKSCTECHLHPTLLLAIITECQELTWQHLLHPTWWERRHQTNTPHATVEPQQHSPTSRHTTHVAMQQLYGIHHLSSVDMATHQWVVSTWRHRMVAFQPWLILTLRVVTTPMKVAASKARQIAITKACHTTHSTFRGPSRTSLATMTLTASLETPKRNSLIERPKRRGLPRIVKNLLRRSPLLTKWTRWSTATSSVSRRKRRRTRKQRIADSSLNDLRMPRRCARRTLGIAKFSSSYSSLQRLTLCASETARLARTSAPSPTLTCRSTTRRSPTATMWWGLWSSRHPAKSPKSRRWTKVCYVAIWTNWLPITLRSSLTRPPAPTSQPSTMMRCTSTTRIRWIPSSIRRTCLRRSLRQSSLSSRWLISRRSWTPTKLHKLSRVISCEAWWPTLGRRRKNCVVIKTRTRLFSLPRSSLPSRNAAQSMLEQSLQADQRWELTAYAGI